VQRTVKIGGIQNVHFTPGENKAPFYIIIIHCVSKKCANIVQQHILVVMGNVLLQI